MNTFEQLEEQACKDGIDIIERRFNSERIKGLYCSGNIALSDKLETSAEKACVLAEELGHHHTSIGDIMDMSDSQNRKQERQARMWGYNKLIGLTGIVKAFQSGCHSRHETAAYLDVTEEFLQECIDCYRDKYGVCTTVDKYTVFFIPNLAVMEEI